MVVYLKRARKPEAHKKMITDKWERFEDYVSYNGSLDVGSRYAWAARDYEMYSDVRKMVRTMTDDTTPEKDLVEVDDTISNESEMKELQELFNF